MNVEKFAAKLSALADYVRRWQRPGGGFGPLTADRITRQIIDLSAGCEGLPGEVEELRTKAEGAALAGEHADWAWAIIRDIASIDGLQVYKPEGLADAIRRKLAACEPSVHPAEWQVKPAKARADSGISHDDDAPQAVS